MSGPLNVFYRPFVYSKGLFSRKNWNLKQSHENPNFKAYVNGSLYSVLSIQEFKDYAKEMGLEALLSSFMKEDEKDTENYGVSILLVWPRWPTTFNPSLTPGAKVTLTFFY